MVADDRFIGRSSSLTASHHRVPRVPFKDDSDVIKQSAYATARLATNDEAGPARLQKLPPSPVSSLPCGFVERIPTMVKGALLNQLLSL